ncbi:MAG: XdhC family protein [Alphaproteobacteria bacterium]
MQRETLKALLEAREARRALVLVTPLCGGEEELVTEDGFSKQHPYAKNLRECFRSGDSKVIEGEGGEVFLQAFLPAPRLMIIGATHIAQVLVRLSREVGIEPFVIDPRTAFATQERFAGVEIITQWPGEALGNFRLDRRSGLVCLAHVPDIDDEALCAALGSECFYIGALGSRRSHAKRVERLKAKGYSEEDLGVIHGPAGLDIGSVSPDEIALSIIAEIVKTLRSKGGG